MFAFFGGLLSDWSNPLFGACSPQFLLWWYESHRGGRKNDSYTARFKLLSAKLQSTDFELDRLVRQESGERSTIQYRVHYYYKVSV